jgi:hypothetical protein
VNDMVLTLLKLNHREILNLGFSGQASELLVDLERLFLISQFDFHLVNLAHL